MAKSIDWIDLELKTPKIGFGTFSDVYRATLTTKNGNKLDIAAKQFRDIVKGVNIHKEIKYLSNLQHDHIIKIFGISVDPLLRTYILMEYADCGSLSQYIHDNTTEPLRNFRASHSLNLMHQCAKAVEFLHKKKPKIIHRDLKPHNLLLFNDYQILKIGDFGTVTQMASQLTTNVGTAAYMAPEIYDNKQYTEKCDVYSFGIILWEAMSYQKPFSHLENREELAIMLATSRGDRPPLSAVYIYENTEDIKRLIEGCWCADPKERFKMKHLELMLLECL